MAVKLSFEQAYSYAELLEILSYTDTSLVQKIPSKLIDIFQNNALSTYENHIDKEIPIEDQDISPKTASLIALLSLNYWCESDEEKNELKSILVENEKQSEQELREKYNPNNIFNNSTNTELVSSKNSNSKETDNIDNSSNLPLDYTNLPWYKKIFTTLKNFLLKIFKKSKNQT